MLKINKQYVTPGGAIFENMNEAKTEMIAEWIGKRIPPSQISDKVAHEVADAIMGDPRVFADMLLQRDE